LALVGALARGASGDEAGRPWIDERLARAIADPSIASANLAAQRAGMRASAEGELSVVLEPPKGQRSDALPLRELEALGARIEARSRSLVRLRASPAALGRIAALGGFRALRFPQRPVALDGSGSTLSQAVPLIGASAMQALGVDGTGVSIAVVDLGFASLGNAKTLGEIPASAIELDFSGTGIDMGTAHGTAVAEEVADVAPGAQLYLIKVGDDVDFENAVDYLRDNGIRIANLSVNWFGTSYYDDTGAISDLINRSHDVDGVFWAVAVGNWAFRHWRGPWLDEDGDNLLSFAPGVERLGLTAELSQLCVNVNWNQYPWLYSGTPTDLDFTVYSASNAVVAQSSSRQSLGAPPVESVCFPRDNTQLPYTMEIRRVSGPTTGLEISIFTEGCAVEIARAVAPASIADPSVAHGAFSVGAVDQAHWNDVTPQFTENFSSVGPTNDGRPKPEVVAPDRTATFAYGAAIGTSFASPVVAGAAALLLQQQPGLSANQLRAALINEAVDAGPVGRDPLWGFGKLAAVPIALPIDSDLDLVPDASDNCPFAFQVTQADTNGDGVGDACTCGDVNGSGSVSQTDEVVLRSFLTVPSATPPRPELCNVTGPAGPLSVDCRINDWAVLRRARAGLGPGVKQVCDGALPP
jgi:subtilisin family serine protease